jgi:hypothetical protein
MKIPKGFIAGVVSAIIAAPLLPAHPLLFALITVLLVVTILVFWTGAISIRNPK